jgi:colanic acid/amylovoran biosynthesis glycosyltransferase
MVIEEMVNCDAFILTNYVTSDGAKEGTPVVLMEAQSLAKPCISTFHAGIPEVVINQKTGFLCKERNIEEISLAMEVLVENKKTYQEFSKNAQIHIEQEFNNEIQTKKIVELYNKVL